jgi:hypothetical protein
MSKDAPQTYEASRCIKNVSRQLIHARFRPNLVETAREHTPRSKVLSGHERHPSRAPKFSLRIRRLGVRVSPSAQSKSRSDWVSGSTHTWVWVAVRTKPRTFVWKTIVFVTVRVSAGSCVLAFAQLRACLSLCSISQSTANRFEAIDAGSRVFYQGSTFFRSSLEPVQHGVSRLCEHRVRWPIRSKTVGFPHSVGHRIASPRVQTR